jgi:hypothetical protein
MGLPSTYQVAGQRPAALWTVNAGGQHRSIDEAKAVAKDYAVIPDDVEFFEAEPGELRGTLEDLAAGRPMETARIAAVTEDAEGYVRWSDHYNRFGRIPVLINPDVLRSDEAIVAVLVHEMYELEELRRMFASGNRQRMRGDDYLAHVRPGDPRNLHDKAWDVADDAVLSMRRTKK